MLTFPAAFQNIKAAGREWSRYRWHKLISPMPSHLRIMPIPSVAPIKSRHTSPTNAKNCEDLLSLMLCLQNALGKAESSMNLGLGSAPLEYNDACLCYTNRCIVVSGNLRCRRTVPVE